MQLLVTSNIEHGIKYCAKDIHRAVLIGAIFVLAVVVTGVPAVGAILVAALEALLEVVLILASRDITLITDRSAAIDIRVRPTDPSVAVAVVASGLKTLSITFVNGLSQQFRTAVVCVVGRTIAVHAITAVAVHVRISEDDADAARVPVVPLSLTTLIGEDALILSVPHGQTLLFQTGTFLGRLSILLVQFFLLFIELFVVMPVAIAVALGVRDLARSQYRNHAQYGDGRQFFKI